MDYCCSLPSFLKNLWNGSLSVRRSASLLTWTYGTYQSHKPTPSPRLFQFLAFPPLCYSYQFFFITHEVCPRSCYSIYSRSYLWPSPVCPSSLYPREVDIAALGFPQRPSNSLSCVYCKNLPCTKNEALNKWEGSVTNLPTVKTGVLSLNHTWWSEHLTFQRYPLTSICTHTINKE